VQPLQTEAGPRSVCARCGEPLPPPNGSATFVYGVGPVGYQSCASCGAKWRYLWQDQHTARVKPERGRRLFFVLGGLALAVLLVVGAVALAHSKPWKSDTPTEPTTPPTSRGTTGSTSPGTAALSVSQAGFLYQAVAVPMNDRRTDFLGWLVGRASATPQYQVNERARSYINGAQDEIAQLEHMHWPESVTEDVGALVEADKTFVDDLDKVFLGQVGSPSYVTMVQTEAAAVRDADNAVRRKLGLPETQT
jgi:RNase P subunit RPR2